MPTCFHATGIVLEPAPEQGLFAVNEVVKGSIAATTTNVRKGDILIAVDGECVCVCTCMRIVGAHCSL